MNLSKIGIRGAAGATAGILCAVSPAGAFAPDPRLVEAQGLQASDGSPVEQNRSVAWSAPASRVDVWRRFVAAQPGWMAQWNVRTGVPIRVFGPGVDAVGSVADGTAAEVAARAWLSDRRDLLTPGAADGDLVLVANHLDEATGIRTIAFEQRHRGLRVIGGQVSVRFKRDRLFVAASSFQPNVDVLLGGRSASAAELDDKALTVIRSRVDEVELRASAGPAVVLPMPRPDGPTAFHVVRKVVVDGRSPLSRWDVYLDASTAEPIAHRQTLMFASGTVRMNVPDRYPSLLRSAVPAPYASVDVGGQTTQTDALGVVAWPDGAPLTGTVRAEGSEVRVINAAGDEATFAFTLDDGGTVDWDEGSDEFVDAQLTTFVAGSRAWAFARDLSPNNQWLSQSRLVGTVNINDTCNAFSDGTTINFFRGSSRCENTGRIVDVVYHEFGHSFHANSIIPGAGRFDSALSEGASDYFSATITNDSGVGRGFFYSDRPLREIDPPDRERRWPEDIVAGDPHTTGLIFAGAMWDLRKLLIREYPTDAEGISATDRLLVATLQRAGDIPSTYVEVLAADDDDGDITNGTPHFCAINAAFALHGLASPELTGPPLGAPVLQGTTLTVPKVERNVDCPGARLTDIQLFWQNRADPADRGTVPLRDSGSGWEAQLPEPAANTVLQYRVDVSLDDDTTVSYPRNRADPLYEVYFGETEVLYCTDFERDPFAEGWRSELVAGENREGANDWQWGPLEGGGSSGDPTAAYSGTSVLGNDLGGGRYNGAYQARITNQVTSPTIDTRRFEVVRLQYRRWLNVEDGDFDAATIRVNGRSVWSNFATGNEGDTHHEDREWRFHDVELTGALNGSPQLELSFRISSDGGLEFGGWTLDDLCVVGLNPDPAAAECGNGVVEEGEACDDGNLIDDDGCESNCESTPDGPVCGDGVVHAAEACDDGNLVDGDGCDSDCTETDEPPATVEPTPADPCDEDPTACGPTTLEDDGCACSTTGSSPTATGLWAAIVLCGLALTRRR